jgi:hypothetical protein
MMCKRERKQSCPVIGNGKVPLFVEAGISMYLMLFYAIDLFEGLLLHGTHHLPK